MGTITVASEDAAAAEATIGGGQMDAPTASHNWRNLLTAAADVKWALLVGLTGVIIFPIGGFPALIAFALLGVVASMFERGVTSKEKNAKALAKAGGKGWIVSPLINAGNAIGTLFFVGMLVIIFGVVWMGW